MRILPLATCGCIAILASACSPPLGRSAGQGDAGAAQSHPSVTAAAAGNLGDGEPDLWPAPLEPEAEKSETGARNVLLAFTRAIELKAFDQAHALMRGEARQRLNAQYLSRQFADFGTITVSVPGGMMEGAAGTMYYTVPATITGSKGRTLEGEIVLSRVNDVPGASENQLRWRVVRLKLTPTG